MEPMKIRIVFLCMTTLAVLVLTLPASAAVLGITGSGINQTGDPVVYPGSTIFSDLGPVGDVYNGSTGWTVSGTGTIGTSFTAANLFNSGIGGSVSQIDLAAGYVTGTNSFYASIWTDVGNLPGTQVAGALWTGLSSSQSFGGCCGLVTISGISGVTLAPSTNYFMILGPPSVTATTWEVWNWNNQNVTNLDLYSTDGGMTWNSNGTQTIGAFDILGQIPEPSTFVLLGTGLLGVLGAVRRRVNR